LFFGEKKKNKGEKSGQSPSPNPALKEGGHDLRSTLQARADGAQDSLVSKKTLRYTGN